jgi:hypothetical protein
MRFRPPLPVLVSIVTIARLVPPIVATPRFRLAGTSLTVPAVIVRVAVADLVLSFTETAWSATV